MTHENKFGMFIHWGIYSIPAVHEQVYARLSMPEEKYESYAREFNPVCYDPEQWVLLAKRAGMKYICFTAKHHDGFCMWDTKYTDYNIMNTPYGKDVLKMLADACHKHGMLLSIYYSNPDWNHPKGNNPSSTHQWRSKNIGGEADTVAYREFVRNQITELLTGYGKIYTLFWDIPPLLEDASLNELARRLQPGIYINDRGWSEGNFSTPEREYKTSAGSRFDSMTEACNSVGVQSWGYREGEDFYSLRHLCSSICRIMSMGGSYLLNVGPDSKGRITEEYERRIERIGDWYNRMDGALECHEADSYDYQIDADACIVTRKGGVSYFNFYNGLTSNAVTMKNAPCLPKSVKLLNTGATLEAEICPMPEFFDMKTGIACERLYIRTIPTDDLENEAIIIAVEW